MPVETKLATVIPFKPHSPSRRIHKKSRWERRDGDAHFARACVQSLLDLLLAVPNVENWRLITFGICLNY
jgi:hypothetical protein